MDYNLVDEALRLVYVPSALRHLAMRRFTSFKGVAAPLLRVNIDTDQIIPKQFLRSVKRTGFGPYLFNSWRYLEIADLDSDLSKLPLNLEFILNQKRYQEAQILLTGGNFGCGSSREHAVWALLEAGFRVLIAPSFADIFSINSGKNGLLLITLPEDALGALAEACAAQPGYELEVNLEGQTVADLGGTNYRFDINKAAKKRLLEGLDDIELTLRHADNIRAYEAARAIKEPWVFNVGK